MKEFFVHWEITRKVHFRLLGFEIHTIRMDGYLDALVLFTPWKCWVFDL